MSEGIAIALIGLLGVVLTLLATLLVAFINLRKHINSRMDEIIKMNRAEGKREGIEQEKIKNKHHDK